MDLDQHLARLGALLDKERAEEKERFAQAPLPERIRKGLALADVEAVEERGLAGRSLVTYARPGCRGAEIRVSAEDLQGQKISFSGPKDAEALDFGKLLVLKFGLPSPDISSAIRAMAACRCPRRSATLHRRTA